MIRVEAIVKIDNTFRNIIQTMNKYSVQNFSEVSFYITKFYTKLYSNLYWLFTFTLN